MYSSFHRLRAGAVALCVAVLMSACSDEPTTEPLPPISTQDISIGTGDTIFAGDTVTLHVLGFVRSTFTLFASTYEYGVPLELLAGTNGIAGQGLALLPNGQTFDLPALQPFPLPRAMTQGLVGMRVGGRRYITVPARIAYGGCSAQENGSSLPAVPSCADVVFEAIVLSKR